MPPAAAPTLKIDVFMILAILGPLTAELNKDLADGKISFDEGVSLAEILAQNAQVYLPGMKAEADLVVKICTAITEYEKAKAP